MKIKMRPEDAGAAGSTEWETMSGWLAELREDGQPEPDSSGSAGTDDGGHPSTGSQDHGGTDSRARTGAGSQDHGGADSRARTGTDNRGHGGTGDRGYTRADSRRHTENDSQGYPGAGSRGRGQPASEGGSRAMPGAAAPLNRRAFRSGAGAHTKLSAPAKDRAPAEAPFVRAVIGDELRMPIAWCEMGSCISRHADRSALGEADIRARAIRAGWRIDALGRLTCPQCQQTSTSFRATRPVVPWDRITAITMAVRAVAVPGNRGTSPVAGANGRGTRRPASGYR